MITPEGIPLNRWNTVHVQLHPTCCGIILPVILSVEPAETRRTKSGTGPDCTGSPVHSPYRCSPGTIRRHVSHEKKYYHHDHRISDPCDRNLYCRLHVRILGFRHGVIGSGTGCCHGTSTKPVRSAGNNNRRIFRLSCRNPLRYATYRYAGELDPSVRNTSGRHGDEWLASLGYTPGRNAG